MGGAFAGDGQVQGVALGTGDGAGLREVFGFEGSYSPLGGWLGLGWGAKMTQMPKLSRLHDQEAFLGRKEEVSGQSFPLPLGKAQLLPWSQKA